MTEELSRRLDADDLPDEAHEDLAEATTVDRPSGARGAAAGIECRSGEEGEQPADAYPQAWPQLNVQLPPTGRDSSGKG